jgi:gluconolactonase
LEGRPRRLASKSVDWPKRVYDADRCRDPTPNDGQRLANERTLVDAGPDTVDGIRIDIDGNLWVGRGMGARELNGVMVFNSDGLPIGRIALSERCANLCFGGEHRNRLFMACGHGLFALYADAQGTPTL